MKAKIEYLLENGTVMKIEIQPSGKEEPEFIATATILNGELFEESKSDTLDMIMSSAMKHVIEMKSWPEMYEIVTTNFQIGQTPMDDKPDAEMGLGLLFGGPRNEA